jgi:redox-sensitive bicupin YhaK (pirin superfamily)
MMESDSSWSRESPFAEPVAWYGAIVINTQEQLRLAFEGLEQFLQ